MNIEVCNDDGDTALQRESEFFSDNLLVRIHFIIVMIRWTGLAPWVFEFPFPTTQDPYMNIDVCSDDGDTALHVAAQGGHLAVTLPAGLRVDGLY